jgi:hypothetical protein
MTKKRSFECEKPVSNQKYPFDAVVPCGKCQHCLEARRLEWANKALLECVGQPRPWLVTWTFDDEHLPDDEQGAKYEIQKLWMRMRRHGYHVRYFNVIERGTKKGRLHGHSLLWCSQLHEFRDPREVKKVLTSLWKNGFIDLSQVRKPAGIKYVMKYLMKSKGETSNYTYSKRPRLGESGLRSWEAKVHHYHEEGVIFTADPDITPMPRTLPTHVLGRVETLFIPVRWYIEFGKAIGLDYESKYKIDFHPRVPFDPLDPENVKAYTSNPKRVYDADLYRQAKAIKEGEKS